MELFINSYGAYIHKCNDCFKVKTEEKTFEVSCKKVSSIILSTSALITTDAIKLAIDNNIDIVLLDEFGNPFARVWLPKLGSTNLIRRRQLEVSMTKAALDFVVSWIGTKFNNQINFLINLRKSRPHRSSEITNAINSLKSLHMDLEKLEGTVDENRSRILGIEGTASKIYFDLLSNLLPERFKFDGRSRNPPQDEFNALLNYSYGILYSKIEKACIIAGLDPFIGFLHTDNYNKKSLVFDLIENYRIWAEEVVFSLFSSRKVKVEMFDKIPNGIILNKSGKSLLVSSFTDYLDQTIRYRNRNIQRKNCIQYDCHSLANKLIGKEYDEK